MNEIGSEFDFNSEYLSDKNNALFEIGMLTYSGRTAIHIALSDILKDRAIDKAWIPSYCCDSMVQPFRDIGIRAEFYSVEYDSASRKIVRAEFDAGKDDVVLTMGYFGFCDNGNTELIRKCQDNGTIVIEDCTHSLLSDGRLSADYQVSSLRKWFPIASGGFVQNAKGSLMPKLRQCDSEIVNMRISAMKEKTEYLEEEKDEELKRSFLHKYKTVNKSFSENYINLAIDPWSEEIIKHTDLNAVRLRRRKNAEMLIDNLRKNSAIKLLFTELKDGDCPLFVPIAVNNREKLQKRLAENKIYCPAHWPRHSQKANSNLYDCELSLVCDQRYNEKDMERIIAVLSDEFC